METEDVEIFNIRGGTIDYGKEYEILMAAYYSLHLSVNPKVVDFKLSTNNKDMGDFDDVVIELEFENNDRRLLALQLKHHANNKPTPIASLASEKGDFSLYKYCQQYKLVKEQCRNKYDLDFDKFYFLLYTNSPIMDFVTYVGKEEVEVDEWKIPKSDITIFKHDICVGNELINTYQPKTKSIYRFEDPSQKLDPQFLNQFRLYTRQKHAIVVREDIVQDFRSSFLVDDKNIPMNYLQYFKNWCQGVFGHKDRSYKLTKADVRAKIAELVLSPHMLQFTPSKSEAKTRLLLQTMKRFQATIANTEIGTTFDVPADTNWKQVLENDPKLLTYLRKFGLVSGPNQNLDQLPQKQVLLILWYLNLAPLFIKVANLAPLLPVLELTRHKRSFVLSGTVSREDFGHGWRIFQTLADLADSDGLGEAVTVSLQNRWQVTIKELAGVDPEILKMVSLEKLIQPVLIGRGKEPLPEYYMKRFIPKRIFRASLLDETEDLLVVSCRGNFQAFQNRVKTNTINIGEYLLLDAKYEPKKFTLSYYRQFVKNSLGASEHTKTILVAEDMCSNEDFAKVVKRNPTRTCHHFAFMDQENLEWIQSTSIQNLRQYRKDHADVVKDEDVFQHFDRDLYVLCADPGMGKSVMVNFLTHVAPRDFYTIKIDLNLHYKFCKESHSVEHLLSYLLADQDPFSRGVAELFFKKGRVVVLWDSFDEMPQEIVKTVLGTITALKSRGLKQWIMGRYHYRDILEETFQVFSLTLRQLSDEEQKEYAHRRLQDQLPADLFDPVMNKMYENLAVLSKCDYLNFAGVPLQVHMLVEIFLEEPEKYASGDVQIVTITDIYKNFLEGKFRTFYDKMNPDLSRYLTLQIQENYQKDRLGQYRSAALKAHLEDHDYLKLYVDCDDLIGDIKDGRDNLGIIVRIDDDDKPIFAHKTYSEYLVASWLVANMKKRKDFMKVVFRYDFINVRLMFDMILAKASKPHLALLYRNFNFFQNCPQEMLLARDEAGRNLLHLASSWGPRCRKPVTTKTVIHASYTKALEVDPDYVKTFDTLLEVLDPNHTDDLFQWDAATYADQGFCFLAIDMIGHFDRLENLGDPATIYHYSIMYGCQKIFDWVAGRLPILRYSEGSTILHACARYNRTYHLSKLLPSCSSLINTQNSAEETPLDVASGIGHLETVKFLLDKGADVNGGPFRPLSRASKAGHVACCLELLNRGASFLDQALVNASMGPSSEIIDILISKGAEVNCRNCDGLTPLLAACTKNNLPVVKKLLELGADPKVRTRGGTTALDMAFGLKFEDHVYEIVKADRAVVELCDQYNVPPLINAISHHFDKVVPALIDQGADVNRLNFPSPPLHTAVYEDKYSYVAALLEAGASPNLFCEEQYVPLAHVQSVAIFDLLVQHGADIHKVGHRGMTPLHIASYYGRVEIVRRLLDQGADIEAKSSDVGGKTPLFYAIGKNHLQVVDLLLEKGAAVPDKYLFEAAVYSPLVFSTLIDRIKVNECDSNGQTLLHLVSFINNRENVARLLDRGWDINACDHYGSTPLVLAVLGGTPLVVQELLQRGAALDASKLPPLHFAAFLGDMTILGLLLKAGADPNGFNEGLTPLYWMGMKTVYRDYLTIAEKLDMLDYRISDNHEECIKILVESGADVNIRMDNSLTALHVFAHVKRTNLMETLIACGARIDCQDKYHMTPLHYCAIGGFLEGALLLTTGGSRIDVCDVFGKTALAWAVETRNRDVMEALISLGANINYYDGGSSINTTSLVVACCDYSDPETVKWLTEKGADVNLSSHIEKDITIAVDPDDFHFSEGLLPDKYLKGKNLDNSFFQESEGFNHLSPLSVAVMVLNEKTIELLLEAGAQVNKVEERGWTPLIFSLVCQAKYEILKTEGTEFDKDFPKIPQRLVRAGSSVNTVTDDGLTPLLLALSAKNQELFQCLIDNGADPDLGEVLHAASNNHTFTEYLLKAGANPNIPDSDHMTPLLLSVRSDCLETTKLLLESGADVECCDNDGFTPLHFAAFFGFHPIAELLCHSGANIDCQTEEGRAPLHYACISRFSTVVELLIKAGSSVSIRDNLGFTPLVYCLIRANDLNLVKILHRSGARLDETFNQGYSLLHLAAAKASPDNLEYLVQNGACVNAANDRNETSLHISCLYGNYEGSKFLVQAGVDVNGVSKTGDGALGYAVNSGSLDLVRLLLDSGANVNMVNHHGNSSLFLACSLGKLEIVRFLHSRGANIDVVDQDGDLPLHDAAQMGHLGVVEYLVENGADYRHRNKKGETASDLASANVHEYLVNKI